MKKQTLIRATISLFAIIIAASFGFYGTAIAAEIDSPNEGASTANATELIIQATDTEPTDQASVDGTSIQASATEQTDQASIVANAEQQNGTDTTSDTNTSTPLEASEAEPLAAAQSESAPNETADENPVLETQAETQATVFDGVYTIATALSDNARVEIEWGSKNNGAATQVYANNWTAAQRWRISDLGDGYYKIINVGSGKALDVANALAGNGARVQQFDWNGTKAQRWAIEPVADGYRLYSALSTEYVLDLAYEKTANGTRVQLFRNKGTKAQTWVFEKVEAVVPNGEYALMSQVADKALDVAGGSVHDAVNVQQYESNGTLAQRYQLTYDASCGYYTVIGVPTGMALDVSWGGDYDGANVQLYTPNGTAGQKWAISQNGDGTFTLRSAVGGRALDVSGASTANGANVQVWWWNGTNAQKWNLVSQGSWEIPDGVYTVMSALKGYNAVAVSGGRDNAANVATATSSEKLWPQKWVFSKADDGCYTIRNLDSLKMLDVSGGTARNGTNVQQYRQNDKDWQLWKLELSSGGILLRSKADPQFVLDIAGANTSAGANVQVYQANGTKAQLFRLRGVWPIDSNTTFVVKNVESDKALDIVGASRENGASVQLYNVNNSTAQKYRAVSAGGNAFYLVNTNSQKCLDVSTSTRTKIQQWEGIGGKDKQWNISLDYKTGTFTIRSAFAETYLDGSSGTLSLQGKSDTDAQKFILQPASTFKLFLNAGHGEGNRGGYDGGASGNGYTEADLTSDLASRIISVCNEYGIEVVDGRPYHLYYSERLNKAIETGCSAILSLHFNSADGSTSGYMSMVGTWGRHPNSELFNSIIHAGLAQGLSGLPDNGVSYRDDITCVNGDIPASLIEVCFIDNAGDMAYYDARRDYVARKIANSILEASTRPEFNK